MASAQDNPAPFPDIKRVLKIVLACEGGIQTAAVMIDLALAVHAHLLWMELVPTRGRIALQVDDEIGIGIAAAICLGLHVVVVWTEYVWLLPDVCILHVECRDIDNALVVNRQMVWTIVALNTAPCGIDNLAVQREYGRAAIVNHLENRLGLETGRAVDLAN